MQSTKSFILLILLGTFIVFAVPTSIDAFLGKQTSTLKILLAPTLIIFFSYISVFTIAKDYQKIEMISQPIVIILALFYFLYPLVPQEYFTKNWNIETNNKQLINSLCCAILCLLLAFLFIISMEVIFKLWEIKVNGKWLLGIIVLGGLIYQFAPLIYSVEDLKDILKFCKKNTFLNGITTHLETTHKLFPEQVKEKYNQIFIAFSTIYFASGMTERLKEEKPQPII